MSNPWARPNEPRDRPEHSIEVPLDAAPAAAESQDRAEPNWRKVIAVASIAGVALGTLLATVLITQDEDSSPPATTISIADVTTPPTLQPIDTVIPSTKVPSTTTAGAPIAAELPRFPAAVLPGDFTLDAETIGANPAPRVTIEIDSGERFGAAVLTVEHDVTTNRYLSIDGTEDLAWSQQVLVDVPGDEVFLSSGDAASEELRWQTLDGADSPAVLAEQLETLLRSPVRTETLAVATSVEDQGGVELGDGVVARHFEVVLPFDALSEFAGTTQSGGGHDVVVDAFVDARGRLVLVQLFVDIGATRQLVTYRLDHDADVTIERPSVSAPTTEQGVEGV